MFEWGACSIMQMYCLYLKLQEWTQRMHSTLKTRTIYFFVFLYQFNTWIGFIPGVWATDWGPRQSKAPLAWAIPSMLTI